MPDIEVFGHWEFRYGPLDRSDALDAQDRDALKAAAKEAEAARKGANVFVRIRGYWHPVTGDAYEDVWSGAMVPLLGAGIDCYGVVRGEHNPVDRRIRLDALYEEWHKAQPPPTKRIF